MLQGLYIHLVVFITVNAGLVAINWLTRGEDGGWWFWLPMLIWGFGLVVHASTIYLPVFSQKWVDQKTDDLIGRG
jgi:hypothetical protein